MKTLPLALASAAILGLSGCSAIKSVVERDSRKVGENALKAATTGELTKSATYNMEQEHYLGKTVTATVITRIDGEPLPPEHPLSRYVRNVGTTLALAATELRVEDDRPYPLKGYHFIPVRSAAANAVGSPSGFVVVTTGLLAQLRNEDELAAVLAHEIAHVQKGHTMEPVEAARKQEQMTGVLLEGTTDVVHVFFGKVVSAGADFVLDKGFGKKNELAADAFASRILAGAGYDPAALRNYLSRLKGVSASGGFFSRHPPAVERVKALDSVTAKPGPDIRRVRLERARKT